MVTAERRVTPEEYLLIERDSEFRSQYFQGGIYAMAGASKAHNTIVFNINGILGPQLRGKPCQGFAADMRVRTPESNLMTYPDVMVACPPLQFSDDRQDTLLNPVVIVEVISKSTEAFDRGEKRVAYFEFSSLQEYVLVSQDRIFVEHYSRRPDGSWTFTTAASPEDRLAVPSIECSLLLAEIYEKVEFQSSP